MCGSLCVSFATSCPSRMFRTVDIRARPAAQRVSSLGALLALWPAAFALSVEIQVIYASLKNSRAQAGIPTNDASPAATTIRHRESAQGPSAPGTSQEQE